MRKQTLGIIMLWLAGTVFGAERNFDFSQMPTNKPPRGCTSTVAGDGKPGDWKVIMDEVPLALPPLSPNALSTAPHAIVGQLAWDTTDEHFPMLILGDDTYGDFTLTTRFKIVDGLTEQIAGVAFRMQDEKNFYYVRASAMGNTFYFYRVVKGVRYEPIGNQMKIEKGVWHELKVKCEGPNIHILLDGSEALPMLTDPTFLAGKIAYLTKSDAISYFTDTHITYTPQEAFAQVMVRDMMKENSHALVGLKVFMVPPKAAGVRLVASNDETEIGKPGDAVEADVINRGMNYFLRDKKTETVVVTMPLRDRNGDAVAAVRFVMKSFKGQTEENALARAVPFLKKMQLRTATVDSLY